MKIFQTANRGLTALFLKIILVTICIFLTAYVCVFVYDFLGYKSIDYGSPEDILHIFSENETDFEEMAQTLTRTNIIGTLCDEYLHGSDYDAIYSSDSLRNPKYQIRRQKLLGNDDYKIVSSFFEKYGPAYIDGREAFTFCFYTQACPVYLHYIPSEETAFYTKELRRYYSDLICIKGCWYYSE